MKRILILVCFLINSVAFTQCLNTSSVTITPTVNGGTATWPSVVNAQTYSIAIFTHPGNVFTGVQTVTSSTTWTFTGLNANTLYRFQIATICIGGGTSTGFSQNFTTQTGVVAYTPMTAAGYSYKYLKVDSMFHVSAGDTSLLRADKRGGAIVFKNSDSTFYGWNGLKWDILGGASANNLIPYVDTIYLNGDTLKYKKNNVIYGITNIGNFDTTAMSNRIDSKLPINDTAAMLNFYKHWLSGYTKNTDTLAMLNGRVSSITLNTSGSIHTTPTTFTRVGGAWNGTLNLATQSANRVFASPNGSSGVPSFRQLVEGDISSNASTSTRGLLTSTDWNTFNNKVGTSTTISTTAPLQGGGDLSTNRTLSISKVSTTDSGYLSATDYNRFDKKLDREYYINKLNSVQVGKDSLSLVCLGNSNTSMDAVNDINGRGYVGFLKQKFISDNYFLKGYGFTHTTPSSGTYDALAFPIIYFTGANFRTYSTLNGNRNIPTFPKSFVRIRNGGSIDIRKPTQVESPMFNQVIIYYEGSANSNTLDIRVNGTVIGTINSNTGLGLQKRTFILANTRLTQLELLANAGNVDSFQVNALSVNHVGTVGVSVHKNGEFDSDVKQWDSIPQTEFNTYLQDLNADAITLHFGTNEKARFMNLDTFFRAYVRVINKIKVARPNAFILLVGSPYDRRPGTTNADTYRFDSVNRMVAVATGSEYLSLTDLWGTTAIAQGLFQNDNIHYSLKGSQCLADAIYKKLAIQKRTYYDNAFVVASTQTIPADYTNIVLRQIGSSQFLDLPAAEVWGSKFVRVFNSNDLVANTWTIRHTATGLSYVIPIGKAVTIYNYNGTYVIED